MNLHFAIHACRHYGIKGIATFLMRLPKTFLKDRAFIKSLEKTIIRDPAWKPVPGITLIAPLSGGYGLSKTVRDFAIRLKENGIPCQTFDTFGGKRIPESEYAHLLTPLSEFQLNRYTDIVGMFRLPPLPETTCRLSRIGFWEFETGLQNPDFFLPMEIVTMADFTQKIFRRQVPSYVPVSKVLYPFFFRPSRLIDAAGMRTRFGLAEDDFVVLFNFSYRSGYYRKNPEGIVHAFAEAFKDRANAKLVFKTSCADELPDHVAKLHALVDSLGLSDRVVFIDDYLPQDEIVSLTNACDVYLSLHRGEGFGLGIAEAMSLAKPVVVTNYSAPTEFCNADNAMLVPYSMRPVRADEHDVDFYNFVKEWAEPDTHAAAKALRRLYDDRAFAKQLGEKARRFIADHFSDANFKKSVEAFLNRA